MLLCSVRLCVVFQCFVFFLHFTHKIRCFLAGLTKKIHIEILAPFRKLYLHWYIFQINICVNVIFKKLSKYGKIVNGGYTIGLKGGMLKLRFTALERVCR
jgi:hypothetical protein